MFMHIERIVFSKSIKIKYIHIVQSELNIDYCIIKWIGIPLGFNNIVESNWKKKKKRENSGWIAASKLVNDWNGSGANRRYP